MENIEENKEVIKALFDCYKSERQNVVVIRPMDIGLVKAFKSVPVDDIGYDVRNVLRLLKLKYSSGNDAPRGGVSGDFIKVSKAGWAKLNSLKLNLKK